MDKIDPQPLLMTEAYDEQRWAQWYACALDVPAQATWDVPGIHLQLGAPGRSIDRASVAERACTDAGYGTWIFGSTYDDAIVLSRKCMWSIVVYNKDLHEVANKSVSAWWFSHLNPDESPFIRLPHMGGRPEKGWPIEESFFGRSPRYSTLLVPTSDFMYN